MKHKALESIVDGGWLSVQKPAGKPVLRWSTLKGLAAIALFIVLAALIEWAIVVYAVSLGVKDENCFQFPGANWSISILFHIIPVSVIITLAASWVCMARYAAMKPTEKPKPTQKKTQTSKRMRISTSLGKIKSAVLKVRSVAYLWEKVSSATAKSAVIMLLVFSALILLVSVLAYPWLIYRTFASLYQGDPSLLAFVKATNSALQGFAETVAPIGWVCSAIKNTLVSAAPSFRSFASALGTLIKPLVDLPPVGKYLVFQNLAAWISALTVLFYGAYTRKGYRYRRAKRS